jgi:hypothetical protein
MSAQITEAHHITIEGTVTEEQVPHLRAEMGVASCWMLTPSTLIVEAQVQDESVDLSGALGALVRRGVAASATFLISRIVLSD